MEPVARVRVAAPPAEARRLCMRLSRGGIPAAVDDGQSSAELLIVTRTGELGPYRARTNWLVVVGAPGAQYFAAGADEVVVPNEPEILFRRIRAGIERLDLLARVERLNDRVAALEGGIADAAHDVRSPLQAVIGNSELLAHDESLTPRQRECAAAAVRQGWRAMQLAERILESARRREGLVLDPRAVDLGGLVEAVAEQSQAHARQCGVTVVASPPSRPVELRADTQLLMRLLDNLVANAVRFSPRGAQVEISAWRASPRHVRLSVRDGGPGVPAAELPKLVAGLGPGRGLRIAREIAERHGGDLWAESSVGNGSRFFVELPLQVPSMRPRVLLVSDDARWLREVSRTLRAACDVRAMRPAAAKLGRQRTDLVLLDPGGKSGKRFDALRTEAKGAQVPVIELPSELAAARLARTIAQLAP